MKRSPSQRLFIAALAAGFFANPTLSNACTVCMGDANSNMASASNGAIFVMLGVIGSMLAATLAFAFYIYKRSITPIPPHIQLAESMSDEATAQSHA